MSMSIAIAWALTLIAFGIVAFAVALGLIAWGLVLATAALCDAYDAIFKRSRRHNDSVHHDAIKHGTFQEIPK